MGLSLSSSLALCQSGGLWILTVALNLAFIRVMIAGTVQIDALVLWDVRECLSSHESKALLGRL